MAMDVKLIESNPEILGGTYVFSGTRLPVGILFENLAGGLSLDEILDSYPSLKRDQAIEALHQAEILLQSTQVFHTPTHPTSREDTGNVGNLILEYLKRLQSGQVRIERKINELTARVGTLEVAVANLHSNLAHNE